MQMEVSPNVQPAILSGLKSGRGEGRKETRTIYSLLSLRILSVCFVGVSAVAVLSTTRLRGQWV